MLSSTLTVNQETLSCPGIAVRRTASLPLAYVPSIHVFTAWLKRKTWMAGTSPAMMAD